MWSSSIIISESYCSSGHTWLIMLAALWLLVLPTLLHLYQQEHQEKILLLSWVREKIQYFFLGVLEQSSISSDSESGLPDLASDGDDRPTVTAFVILTDSARGRDSDWPTGTDDSEAGAATSDSYWTSSSIAFVTSSSSSRPTSRYDDRERSSREGRAIDYLRVRDHPTSCYWKSFLF